ncbi:MAG: 3-phosphoshikimate 1-carboxyvinyltransferase [Chloroflexi bacterium]|nr:3-phosphoshikimate 1-carboxyvinyltransferase [Chloroflexota bacterium]
MERVVRAPQRLRGELEPPGDKSISHRAVLFNGAARGSALVRNFLAGADCLATVACMQAMGAQVEFLTAPQAEEEVPVTLRVTGAGDRGLHEPADVLNAENSGTTMRLISGLLAAQPFLSILTGDASLRSRPMDRIIRPLRLMGAQIWGRRGDALAPLAIRGGNLHGITYDLPVASAQVKSAVLLAALFADGASTVVEPAPSRDHSERMLRAMGADIASHERAIVVRPTGRPLEAVDVAVPGDISSAAFWMVAGVAHPDAEITLTNVGLNPTRAGILAVLQRMGASIRIERERTEGGEPVADLVVRSSALRGTVIQGAEIPLLIDELPIVAVAACAAQGDTIIRDAAELRVKETDRIAATVQELSRLGARMEELPDGMVIHGGAPLTGAACDSRGDHRLAMSLAIAGLLARGETTVRAAEAVSVSYPGFWRDLDRVAEGTEA